MKFSLKHLLLLVATVAMSTLSADKAAVAAQSDVVVRAEQPATREAAAVDTKSELAPEDSRFLRTGYKALKYIHDNRAFVMQRVGREILIHWLKELAKESKLTDKLKLEASADARANQEFVAKMVDGTLKSAIVTSLKTIKTEEEHWALSMLIAGLTKYCFKKDIPLAVHAALEDYYSNSDAIKHWPKASLLFQALPFINFEGIVKHFTSNESTIKSTKDLFSPVIGSWVLLSTYLAWNPRTRVNTRFEKGSFGDIFIQNMLGRALIPAMTEYMAASFIK